MGWRLSFDRSATVRRASCPRWRTRWRSARRSLGLPWLCGGQRSSGCPRGTNETRVRIVTRPTRLETHTNRPPAVAASGVQRHGNSQWIPLRNTVINCNAWIARDRPTGTPLQPTADALEGVWGRRAFHPSPTCFTAPRVRRRARPTAHTSTCDRVYPHPPPLPQRAGGRMRAPLGRYAGEAANPDSGPPPPGADPDFLAVSSRFASAAPSAALAACSTFFRAASSCSACSCRSRASRRSSSRVWTRRGSFAARSARCAAKLCRKSAVIVHKIQRVTTTKVALQPYAWPASNTAGREVTRRTERSTRPWGPAPHLCVIRDGGTWIPRVRILLF